MSRAPRHSSAHPCQVSCRGGTDAPPSVSSQIPDRGNQALASCGLHCSVGRDEFTGRGVDPQHVALYVGQVTVSRETDRRHHPHEGNRDSMVLAASCRRRQDHDEKTEREGTAAGQAAYRGDPRQDCDQRLHARRVRSRHREGRGVVAKYELDPGSFRWPPRPSTPFGSGSSGSKPLKQPQAAVPSRGKGIGKLAERLIVEHSDWTYRRIAEEVNARIEGARASEKSVRWYASRMRR